ncbi:MAG: OmpA family protein, partial [Acidimicrobiia bacterium]|nr:OmpA family protein [Acidimicrobiia bacterium]
TETEAPATEDVVETGEESVEPVTINEELSLDPVTFEVGSATITDEGLAVLDEAAEYLKADPEVTVEIAGHTDSDGDAADNIRLSQARAEEVEAYLESQGIDGARMTPVGYGEDDPIASNASEAGKAQNRRIEFVIQ